MGVLGTPRCGCMAGHTYGNCDDGIPTRLSDETRERLLNTPRGRGRYIGPEERAERELAERLASADLGGAVGTAEEDET